MSEIEKQISGLHELQCKCVENGFYGDIELAEKALEKQIPQFPSCYFAAIYKCPTCGDGVQVEQTVGGIKVHADKFCRNCGQALVEIELISE